MMFPGEFSSGSGQYRFETGIKGPPEDIIVKWPEAGGPRIGDKNEKFLNVKQKYSVT